VVSFCIDGYFLIVRLPFWGLKQFRNMIENNENVENG
jgi:hypothetical protein